ncbi:MAG: flagellar basal body P-ring formation chaperone FlgA [Steroidobacteraceae bacterium]
MNRHSDRSIRPAAALPPSILLLALLAAAGIGAPARCAPASDVESVQAIRAAAVAFVRSQLPPNAQVVGITAGQLDDRLRLARCAGALQAQPSGDGAALAQSTVAVSCRSPVRWRLYVPVTVVRREPVLVLRHAVVRQMVLTPQDVTVESRRVTGFTEAYLTSPTQLTGRAVRRTLAAGTVLTVEMLAPDLIVHRGQEVTLVVDAGGIEVRATGRALEDAAAGARIRVANASSRKIVEGVVESADTIRVND